MYGSRLKNSADSEDEGPSEDGAAPADAIRRERLSDRTHNRSEHITSELPQDRGDCTNISYPAERREVMIDCRELDSVYDPSAFCSPKRSMKSGMMRHP